MLPSACYPSPPGASNHAQPEPKWLEYMDTHLSDDELEPTRQERGILDIIRRMFLSPASDTQAALRATEEVREYYVRLYKSYVTESELLRGDRLERLEEGDYRGAGLFLEHAAGFVLEMAHLIPVEEVNHDRIFEFLKGFHGDETKPARVIFFDHKNPKFLYDPEAIGRAAVVVWKYTCPSVRTGINPIKEDCLGRESFSLILARLLAAGCLTPRHSALLIFDIDLALCRTEQAMSAEQVCAQSAPRAAAPAPAGPDLLDLLKSIVPPPVECGASTTSEAPHSEPDLGLEESPDALDLLLRELDRLAQAEDQSAVPSLASSRTTSPPPPAPVVGFLQRSRVAIAGRHVLIAGGVLARVAREGFHRRLTVPQLTCTPVRSASGKPRYKFTRTCTRHDNLLGASKWDTWYHKFNHASQLAANFTREFTSGVPLYALDLPALGLDPECLDQDAINTLAGQVAVENQSMHLVAENAAYWLANLWSEAIRLEDHALEFPVPDRVDECPPSVQADTQLYGMAQVGHGPVSHPGPSPEDLSNAAAAKEKHQQLRAARLRGEHQAVSEVQTLSGLDGPFLRDPPAVASRLEKQTFPDLSDQAQFYHVSGDDGTASSGYGGMTCQGDYYTGSQAHTSTQAQQQQVEVEDYSSSYILPQYPVLSPDVQAMGGHASHASHGYQYYQYQYQAVDPDLEAQSFNSNLPAQYTQIQIQPQVQPQYGYMDPDMNWIEFDDYEEHNHHFDG